MEAALLSKFYPLNLLSPAGLRELAKSVKVRGYEDGDYVYRLWDDENDLLYILEGTIQILDSEKNAPYELSAQDEQALRPFSHEISSIEAAIAKQEVKILKVNFSLFSSIMSLDSSENIKLDLNMKPRDEEVAQPQQIASDPEPLQIDDFKVDDIELKPINTRPTSVSRSGIRQPAANSSVGSFDDQENGPYGSKDDEAIFISSQRPARFSRSGSTPVVKAGKTRVTTDDGIDISDTFMDKLVQRLKQELTEERVFDLKLLKSASPQPKRVEASPARQQTTQSAPGARTPSASQTQAVQAEPEKKYLEKVIQRVKQELTEERKLDLKLVKSAPKPEPKQNLSEIDRYMNAMILYKQHDWPAAHAAFLALTIDHPTTNLYAIYASRCSDRLSEAGKQTA